MAKIKCSKPEWYYQLNSFTGTWETELLNQQTREDYDGPALYLEVFGNPGLPKNSNVMFWVRVGKDLYQQYYYQDNKWFKAKELNNGFYDFQPMFPKQRTIDAVLKTPSNILRKDFARLKIFLEWNKYRSKYLDRQIKLLVLKADKEV